MDKIAVKPDTIIGPVPVAMVSCGSNDKEYNIITIAWTGIINSEPPMTYISVRKSRYSHSIIDREREFVINLFGEGLLKAADWCGMKSGRDVNKFKEMNLTASPAAIVRCPLIKEAPVNVECVVSAVLNYPSHDMFVADIVKVNADSGIINDKGNIDISRAGLVAFNNGAYYGLTKNSIAAFGFSL